VVPVLTPVHDAVLALLDWLPEDVAPDAELVAELLDVPETEALRLLEELEAAGCLESATGPVQ
jgi:DNA-binding IclR family transcriptional regulator